MPDRGGNTGAFRKLYAFAQDPEGLSRQLKQLQDNSEEATRQARGFPENAGKRVSKIRFDHDGATSATVEIEHGLLREPDVVRPVKQVGSVLPPYKILEQSSKRLVMKVTGTVSASVDFWVS